MLKYILIGMAVIVVLFIVIVAMRPSDFRVMRSAVFNAPPEAVFPHLNNLRKWELWSPWAKLDPNAKSTFEGPDEGAGASMTWDGNRNVGAGRMTITESRTNEFVRFRLDFEKPMKGTSDAEFTFKPQGNQTAVTWTMYGKNNFMAKAVGLFINCDDMIGGQFEKGLASLKAIVEEPTKAAAAK
jgi:uncharacterized protein YndB with AHSA1/START domain